MLPPTLMMTVMMTTLSLPRARQWTQQRALQTQQLQMREVMHKTRPWLSSSKVLGDYANA